MSEFSEEFSRESKGRLFAPVQIAIWLFLSRQFSSQLQFMSTLPMSSRCSPVAVAICRCEAERFPPNTAF